MSARNDIAPSTIGVELDEGGVYVEYTDGRRTFYNGVPEKVHGTVRCRPGKDVHVLVTDPSETEGVLVYVNDLKTHDDILDDPPVSVRLTELGDSYVGLKSRFWIANPSRSDFVKTRSTYVQRVKERFDEAGIDIPYPIRTLDGEVELSGSTGAGQLGGSSGVEQLDG